jgi:hypothetical protein
VEANRHKDHEASRKLRDKAVIRALSDQHKEAVRSWVPRVRRVLEGEFAAQLERLGCTPSGKHIPVARMHLSEDAVAVRRRVEALLARDGRRSRLSRPDAVEGAERAVQGLGSGSR